MRLIGQPNMWSVKIMKNGVIINAYETAGITYTTVLNRANNFISSNYTCWNDYEVLIRKI